MQKPAPPFKSARKMALEEIINDRLVELQAKEMELTVTSDEVDSAIENMALQNNMDIETFRTAIESQGGNMAEYKKGMRKDLLKYKVMNLRVRGRVNISEQRARDYYNNQVRDVRQSAWYQGAHILIPVPANAKAIDVARLRKKATTLLESIKNGKSFEDVAKESSADKATAQYGGHLGKRMPGDIPKILNQAFLNMEPGEIAGPIRTSAGFHILKLASRENTGVKPFAEVKQNIISQLTQKEMERQQKIWLKELRKKVFISIRL
jgi:peptidyl-prolyl cis-trans isomerase SurA